MRNYKLQLGNAFQHDPLSRFLKSDLYKEALLNEMTGASKKDQSLDASEAADTTAATSLSKHSLGRKSKEDRRRSLLPWNNLRSGKDRSKSKDRESSSGGGKRKADSRSSLVGGSSNVNCADASKISNGSQSSTEGGNSGGDCSLARVILPDKATTVVQTRSGETIRAMVSRLLEKRGLRYTSFDVFASGSDKPMDLGGDCAELLGCTEVRVEPRVLFRLELPSKKSIGVKAKPAKVIRDVLGPILQQYGWNLDEMGVVVSSPGNGGGEDPSPEDEVNLGDTVQAIDNLRLAVIDGRRMSARGSVSSMGSASVISRDKVRHLT